MKNILYDVGIKKKDEKYAVISPITAFRLKNWNFLKWQELCQRLHDELGIRTVLIGDTKYKSYEGIFSGVNGAISSP